MLPKADKAARHTPRAAAEERTRMRAARRRCRAAALALAECLRQVPAPLALLTKAVTRAAVTAQVRLPAAATTAVVVRCCRAAIVAAFSAWVSASRCSGLRGAVGRDEAMTPSEAAGRGVQYFELGDFELQSGE